MTVLAIERRRRPDWRKLGLAAASIAINVGLIAILSFTGLGIRQTQRIVEPPLIYLDIEPRPLLPDERPRPAVSAPVQAQTPRSETPSRALVHSPTTSAPTTTSQDRPSPINPRIAAPAPQSVPAPDNQWTVSSDRTAAMGRTLRQGLSGCTNPQMLSREERQQCEDRRAQIGRNAAPITGTGNPARDAAFAREGARRLAQWEADRRPLSGGVGIVGPADCVGSNFGTGCAGAQLDPSLAPDSSSNVQTRRDGHRAGGAPITPGAPAPRERWKD